MIERWRGDILSNTCLWFNETTPYGTFRNFLELLNCVLLELQNLGFLFQKQIFTTYIGIFLGWGQKKILHVDGEGVGGGSPAKDFA